MHIHRIGGSYRVTPIVLAPVVLGEISIGIFIGLDFAQSQFLDEPVLVRAMTALDASFGLRGMRADHLDSQLRAHASELRDRYDTVLLLAPGRLVMIHIFPIHIQSHPDSVRFRP